MDSEWIRADSNRRCPVCGKFDWCLIAVNGGAAICPRTEDKAVAYIEGSGWLHKFGDESSPKPRLMAQPKPLPEHNSVLADVFNRERRQITPDLLQLLSGDLSITPKSLDLMGVGFSETKGAFSFPMTRHGRRFLGIRYRTKDGSKFAAKGSKQGIFVPASFTLSKAVVICEGPTDTAAMLDLGFNAIGRASCNAGHRLVAELTQNNPVAILADADEAGRIGAEILRRKLKRAVIIEPNGFKDAREWVANGATRGEVMEVISKARNA
jgi:5S rRNA maturation endonuclease (ribonuclease M5)